MFNLKNKFLNFWWSILYEMIKFFKWNFKDFKKELNIVVFIIEK